MPRSPRTATRATQSHLSWVATLSAVWDLVAASTVRGVINPYELELMHAFAGMRRRVRRYKQDMGVRCA